MLQILSNRAYAQLFTAQVVAVLGTGLLTIALGLTAFDLAGDQAGQVLGLALTVKMLAYVGVSPVVTALVSRMDRRRVLVVADLIRVVAALCLPFVTAPWQIYLLIFVLQAASATFTPTFQAVIPDILPDEADYTRALSLSRLAYDLESLVSPILAGLLLGLMMPSSLFLGTALGFTLSALLVWRTRIPNPDHSADQPFLQRLTKGGRIYLATPRLRGLMALNLTVAAVGAVPLVLSVVVARSVYAGSERDMAVLLGAYGAGSMCAALALPRLLDRLNNRPVMLIAGALAALVMTGFGLIVSLSGWPAWSVTLLLWAILGASLAAIMTPSGRLLRQSAQPKDRAALFAAQFALSHACWLITYPAAGFLGSLASLPVTMVALGLLGVIGTLSASLFWSKDSDAPVPHVHADLPHDHPHLKDAVKRKDGWQHQHQFIIDEEHRAWPTSG